MSIGSTYFYFLVFFRQCLYNHSACKRREARRTNRFKEARLRAGLSQKAAAISLGIRPPSMSDWESGKTKPTHVHLAAMASLYHTTVDYLVGASDIKEKQPAVQDGELLEHIVMRLRDLPDPALSRVSDFLQGLQAGQEIVKEAQAENGPAGEPAE